MVPLPLPRRRRLPALPPPLLLLGLGLSTTLVVASLGLRGRVLLVALLPPAAGLAIAASLAAQDRHQALCAENPGGPDSLLDPQALARRLEAQAPPVRASSGRRGHAPAAAPLSSPLWRQRCWRLQEIRALALAWAQRDPHATVDLLVLLEELLERLPQPDAEGALERDLERVRHQLASPGWTAATLPPRSRP
ncbi:MAG: hypothetical protein ACKOZW_13525 [Cyanobium sp.]